MQQLYKFFLFLQDLELNKNLAQMLKGGVIMDVTTEKQAKIAQDSGAVAVMALEKIQPKIRPTNNAPTIVIH